MKQVENLSINIATLNGTGSLSANQLLTKILFRSGWEPGSYNFFPSNIAGLPCLYNLRLSAKAYTGFSPPVDILISLNPKSLTDDLKDLKTQGLLISDKKDNVEKILKAWSEKDSFKGLHWPLPLSDSLKNISGLSPRAKILMKNILYVSLLCEWLNIEEQIIVQTLGDFFQKSKNSEIIQQNLQVIQMGQSMAKEYSFPYSPPKKTLPGSSSIKSGNKILIDGNSSSALGALSAGCQFLSWYPITPASSLAENFQKFAEDHQKDDQKKRNFMLLQSEDEIAAITQSLGAGWAGLRAMTTTSGPGLSLMSESAGLSYFAEIPLVLCNVQRAGPSTGLPTRTQQGDLLASCFLSHGDSKHIVLLPGTPEEAFHFTIKAFELAEEFQTLVIVLSDLDLGMNLRVSSEFSMEKKSPLKRRVLTKEDLEKINFIPYDDPEKDGLSYRTLPGIQHEKGVYLNRGSGHNKNAEYSERHQDYSWKLDKLERKWQTAKKFMPEPIIESFKDRKTAFVTFGPNEQSLKELRDQMEKEGLKSNFLRIRSFPFPKSVESFLKNQSDIFVVEQNSSAQMKQLLSGAFPEQASKMKSLLQYDGRPLMSSQIKKQLMNFLNLKTKEF